LQFPRDGIDAIKSGEDPFKHPLNAVAGSLLT
jgi:hypothetical protein